MINTEVQEIINERFDGNVTNIIMKFMGYEKHPLNFMIKEATLNNKFIEEDDDGYMTTFGAMHYLNNKYNRIHFYNNNTKL